MAFAQPTLISLGGFGWGRITIDEVGQVGVALARPTFWLTEHDVLGNDEHVCALGIMGAQRNGVDVQTRVVSVFHYRDGQQFERCFYPEDCAAWDQIFAE
jgi:hypothetical protein